MTKRYFVDLVTNPSGTLYTGVTNDLARRVYEHKQGFGSAFTSKYRIRYLIYYEECSDPRDAIAREKQIKGWRWSRKIALIEDVNPEWRDSSEDWYDTHSEQPGSRDQVEANGFVGLPSYPTASRLDGQAECRSEHKRLQPLSFRPERSGVEESPAFESRSDPE